MLMFNVKAFEAQNFLLCVHDGHCLKETINRCFALNGTIKEFTIQYSVYIIEKKTTNY
jgi:hypothetical protein